MIAALRKRPELQGWLFAFPAAAFLLVFFLVGWAIVAGVNVARGRQQALSDTTVG